MVVVASPFVRETLSRALRALGASDVVEAGSLAEARVRGRGSAARDLCVVDGALPDGSGISLMGELRALGWSRGLVLSSVEDPYTVRAALVAGVRAFLVTPSATTQRGVAAVGQLPGQHRTRGGRASGAEGLSGREVEVLQLVSEGRSNKDIGEALGLSALTVKSHLARIARKLGTGDRAEMVVVAMRAGVVV
ncbi:MAG: response regulator transcription factor [Actinomycetes bacterium]